MEKLLAYLNGLSKEDRADFVLRAGTTEGYLRKAISVGASLREGLCIRIERESGRAVLCEDLRADVDWAYMQKRPVTGKAIHA
jgi:DNA-binding transcriptional regulator YdaS (Cro superfamily)